ncbi:MAG: DUF5103 domain-containing protein [Duncaniella sp.]|nr:DUF5103 domain-containing protein [Duncaniella sp.]
MLRGCIITILTLILTLAAHGEQTDTRQGVMEGAFKTLQVRLGDDIFAPPVLNLANPGERIVISFDELAEERRYLRYSLVHCDASWQPEGLVDSEFLDSFNEGIVEDYDYSQATVVHYVHYTIALPNQQVRITQPGNYLVRVYDENDPDRTLLQARFGVCDFTAPVMATVSSRTDIDTNTSHQQLALQIDTRHLHVDDPFNDLRVVITQNGRPDNEVTLTTPQRINGDRVIYEHLRPLIFDAGNEYRRFETTSVDYPGLGVERVIHDAPVYNAELYTDSPRDKQSYLYDSTQQGRYVVRSVDTQESDTEADYVLTHFTLLMPPIAGADIFIDGDLTDRRMDPSSHMVYNHSTGAYEQSMLLKQGAYNYQYLVVPNGSDRGLTAPVEGNKYQTVNEYTIRVYHRPRGTRFDRLVGITTVKAGL